MLNTLCSPFQERGTGTGRSVRQTGPEEARGQEADSGHLAGPADKVSAPYTAFLRSRGKYLRAAPCVWAHGALPRLHLDLGVQARG